MLIVRSNGIAKIVKSDTYYLSDTLPLVRWCISNIAFYEFCFLLQCNVGLIRNQLTFPHIQNTIVWNCRYMKVLKVLITPALSSPIIYVSDTESINSVTSDLTVVNHIALIFISIGAHNVSAFERFVLWISRPIAMQNGFIVTNAVHQGIGTAVGTGVLSHQC